MTIQYGKANRALLVCALGAFFCFQGGCASPSKTAPLKGYVLAARYDLGKKSTVARAESAPPLLDDLKKFKSLGFNAAIFDYADDADRAGLIEAAANCGLRAYVTDRDLHYFLLTGKLRGFDSLTALIAAKLRPLTTHADFAGIAILSGYPRDRVSEVCTALESSGIPTLIPGQSGYPAGHASVVAWLDADATAKSTVSPVERLLLELNGEIQAGWNDGLVIDFTPMGDKEKASLAPIQSEGVSDQNRIPLEDPDTLLGLGALPASNPRSKIFAVESLLRRANTWGGRLQGFERQSISLNGVESSSALQTALFVRGARRYLFIHNQSSLPFRRAIRFPSTLDGKPAARAVGIPATSERVAGEVYEARGGELAVQVNLRPGDAALFELF